ncbi:transposase [Brucella intermedia]|uniref:transposase n=1 Tax=Brucella intermedia TaxID=94625 RepID=UPI00235E1023|nr:transposase [Brucella intermedia]
MGLVPRQFSSVGKERLGEVSKAGQADIRRLLIIGAMTQVRWACRKETSANPGLTRMLGRKPECWWR